MARIRYRQRGRWRALGRLTAVASAAVVSLGFSAQATAATFHGYSVAYETSAAGSYTGVKVTRTDPYFTISPGQNCFTTYTAPVVYQTQWVIITSDAQNWVELGTGDQCNGYQYLYWGYGNSGVWHSLGVTSTPGSGTHTFDVHRVSGSTWQYYVDGSLKGTFSWSVIGAQLSAGLESWDVGAVAPKHTYQSLSRATNEGSFILWAGYDNWWVNPTPTMCGGWDTESQWRAAENATC